jgi:AbrB family looped-hinge helix DNA binding protein
MDRILGDSRVQPNFRVTLTKEVRRRLKVKVGDTVAFSEGEDGSVVIRKAELRPV